MLHRVLTAVGIAAALPLILFALPPLLALGAFALVAIMAAWEWSLFPGFRSVPARMLYVLVLLASVALAWYWSATYGQLPLLLWLSLLWWSMAFAWIVLAPALHNRSTAALGGLLVLVPAAVALLYLYQVPVQGPQLVLFLLLLVWAADVGAFFAGRSFGRLKLAPQVSPKKTWEGLLGGMVVSAVVAVAGAGWFPWPPLAFISLCMAVVLISVVGDLTESMFKRFAGLKDSGSVFPGHGGVLDRFDSVCAAAPVFVLGLRWLESLP